MSVVQRNADLAVGLESSDARAMAGAWIDDEIGALPLESFDACGRDDAHQLIIHGTQQAAPIYDDFGFIGEHGRRAGSFMRRIVFCALSQNVQGQDRAAPRILRIGARRLSESAARMGGVEGGEETGKIPPEGLRPLAMRPTDPLEVARRSRRARVPPAPR